MVRNTAVETIVVAVDDTTEGYAAAELAASWFSPEAEVLALHVVDDERASVAEGGPPAGGGLGYPVSPLGDLHERLTSDPTGALDVARRAARIAGGRGGTRTGDAATQIVTAAGDIGADLIVMGAHHHGLLGRLLGADTTSEVVADAPCPVLVVPQPT